MAEEGKEIKTERELKLLIRNKGGVAIMEHSLWATYLIRTIFGTILPILQLGALKD